MSNKRRGLLIITILVISTMLISACTQSLSSAPVNTPTVIPTGAFASPVPSAENPMAVIEEFAKQTQTSVAQTMVAGGTPVAPAVTTVQPGDATSAAQLPVTPTNAISAGTTPSAPNPTAVPSGARPASYTLQEGEFPYCIARRFNVDPAQLLSLSGLTSPDVYYEGLALKIPQSGAFPGERSLASHPSTYTVLSSSETLYSIACKYGDVDPAAIASANGLSISAALSAGQSIKIP